ncbi:MAG TPA: hypothetical protein ENI05_00160 [Porticoccus sp.]|nr:hypothetical protein [Porticoccus sp.]
MKNTAWKNNLLQKNLLTLEGYSAVSKSNYWWSYQHAGGKGMQARSSRGPATVSELKAASSITIPILVFNIDLIPREVNKRVIYAGYPYVWV